MRHFVLLASVFSLCAWGADPVAPADAPKASVFVEVKAGTVAPVDGVFAPAADAVAEAQRLKAAETENANLKGRVPLVVVIVGGIALVIAAGAAGYGAAKLIAPKPQ